MADAGYTRNVGFVGSISLLISSITGPGIVLIPLVYQQAGWLIPTIVFLVIAFFSALSGLFTVEAISRFPGNDNFNRNVEFTVMVHQFYGRYVYYFFIFILYGSLQSTNIASLVGSAQIFDSIFVRLFGGTCGIGISPINEAFCVSKLTDQNSQFGDNYMLLTFGYALVMMIIIPLTSIDLNDNMLLQLVSIIYCGIFLITLAFTAMFRPLLPIPVIGEHGQDTIGQHERVNSKKAIWYSVSIAVLFYILIGAIGAISYKIPDNANLLSVMYKESKGGFEGFWFNLIYIIFPILTYITSIPVAMIVVRLNLLAAKICSPQQATFYAVYVPILIGIPLQGGSLITTFGTYTSLSFQSMCNFFAPFLIFCFLSKRKTELAQSVLEELEFLDISAGVKKGFSDDDDFDYIYHLPTANPDQIRFRDPFQKTTLEPKKDAHLKSISQLSSASRHSIKQIRNMLDPNAGKTNTKLRRRNLTNTPRRDNSVVRREGTSNLGTGEGRGLGGSSMNLATSESSQGGLGASLGSGAMVNRRPSLVLNKPPPPQEEKDSSQFSLNFSVDVGDEENGLISFKNVGAFRALPDICYIYVKPVYISLFCLIVMLAMVLEVVITSATK